MGDFQQALIYTKKAEHLSARLRQNEILILKESFLITGNSPHSEVSSGYMQELTQARALLEGGS